jgi:4-alpha-glucanotransferase
VPGDELFTKLAHELGPLPLIAEDLGAVTPEVLALRDRFGLPGIRILQFAFGTDLSAHDFLPHNYPRKAVVYTGTHDNDTVAGWFSSLPAEVRLEVEQAIDAAGVREREPHWSLIRLAHASPSRVAMAQIQDVLGLGSGARMNTPGSATGAWKWQLDRLPTAAQARRLREVTEASGRTTR